MKKIALIVSMLFFYTYKALALECAALDDKGSEYYKETISVDQVLIPKNAKDDQKIWSSPVYTRNVKCSSAMAESVYFYFFPDLKLENIPKGMIFGINYLGLDHDLDISIDENKRRVKTNIDVDGKKPTESSISVQLYIKKHGEIDTSSFSGGLDIYQLDGVQGLNYSTLGRNYRFSLSQLNKITEVTCDSSYSWNKFNIYINNELTLSSQKISNIGNLNLSCHAYNDFDLKDKKVTLDLYPDKQVSTDTFTTDLEGLNFTFDVLDQEIKPNNSSTNPKKITVSLGDKGNVSIPVDGLFKLDYNPPGKDWLYDSKTSKFTPEDINIKSNLTSIE